MKRILISLLGVGLMVAAIFLASYLISGMYPYWSIFDKFLMAPPQPHWSYDGLLLIVSLLDFISFFFGLGLIVVQE